MEPRCTDVLRIRKSLQDALADMFGLTFASTYIDVLSVNEPGSETVLRVHSEYVPSLPLGVCRLNLIKETHREFWPLSLEHPVLLSSTLL